MHIAADAHALTDVDDVAEGEENGEGAQEYGAPGDARATVA